jgi:hypothetical protein
MLRIPLLSFAAVVVSTLASAQQQFDCSQPSVISAGRGIQFGARSTTGMTVVTIRRAPGEPGAYRISTSPALQEPTVVTAAELSDAEAHLCGSDWAQRNARTDWRGEQQKADSALTSDAVLKPRLNPGWAPWIFHEFIKWLDKAAAHGLYDFLYGKHPFFNDGNPLLPTPSNPFAAKLRVLEPFALANPSSAQAAGRYVAGDFNGDGIEDSASFGANLQVTLYNASGQVATTHFYPISQTSGQVLAADFNGDGILDLAIVSQTSSNPPIMGNVAVLLGHGDGTFGSPVYFQAGPNPLSIAAGDFNGDGKLDLAVGNQSGASTPGTVSLFIGKGDGTFSAGATYNAGLTPLSMISTDFNNDGKADLAVLDTSRVGPGDTLYMFLGNGDGTLRTPLTSNPGTSIGALAYTDLNHDGKQDLLISDLDGGGVAVLFGNGDGTFQSAGEYVASGNPEDVAPEPESDGSTAVGTADDVSGYSWVFYILNNGTVVAPPLQRVGTRPVAIASADFNHDGKSDVVIADAGTSSLLVLLSNSGGNFSSPATYSISRSPVALAIADVNNDGNPDLIAEDGNGIDVLLGKGDGTFGAAITSAAAIGSSGFVVADFNSDGKPDIALFNSNGDVSILYGNGSGSFSAGPTLSLSGGATPAGIFAGDFNNDGKQDLAVAYDPASGGFTGSINVLLGDGHGAFQSAGIVSIAGTVLGISAADLNHDGKLDLIARYFSSTSSGVAIALGKGNGTFQAPAYTSTIAGGSGIVVTDLNGDGNPDLVLTDGSEPSYLLGNGDGTFQTEFQFPSGPGGNFIAAANLNGNGNPGLVIAGNIRGHGTLVALINDTPTSPVEPVTANPASGSGTTPTTFTFTFTDSAGYQNLNVVDVLINSALDGRHACYIAFQPSGANGGSVFLVDDSGDAGGPYQGLVLPGSGSISNSQCTVNGASSSVSGNGNTLTLMLNISFTAGFSGNKIFYLSAQDKSSNNSGWQALGTWSVPGGQIAGPTVSGMNPAHTNVFGPTTYTFTFTDTNGWQDISVADILSNSAIDGRHACYIAIVPATNSVYLVDDAGDAAGPFTGFTVPPGGSASNSQCTVGGAGAALSGSGTTLTVTLPITFSASFAGNQVFFLAARSNSANSNWQAVGSIAVP